MTKLNWIEVAIELSLLMGRASPFTEGDLRLAEIDPKLVEEGLELNCSTGSLKVTRTPCGNGDVDYYIVAIRTDDPPCTCSGKVAKANTAKLIKLMHRCRRELEGGAK